MRITKKWLRVAKDQLEDKVTALSYLSDKELAEEFYKRMQGIELETWTREELLVQHIRWAIEDALPWAMCN